MDILKGLTVLLVEDDPDGREMLTVTLEHYGADVDAVDGADAARCRLAIQTPSVIISDIGMPGEDGYSLMRSIRALAHPDKSRTPAIALTAFDTAKDRQSAFLAGFDSHMPKPVRADLLASIVRALVSMKKCVGG